MNPIELVRNAVRVHHVRRVALVAGGIGAALLAFILGIGVRLLIGPVSLGPFAGSLADAIDQALPGITVRYDQAAIEWERDVGQVNLVILGTRVFDRDGRIIAQAPKADIDLAAAPLLHGKVAVRRIVLVGVQLNLVRDKEGGLRLGIGKNQQGDDILKRLSDALDKNRGGNTTLQSFAVRRARLAFYDEPTKLFVVAPRTDFRLTRASDHLVATVNADVEVSGYPAHVRGEVALHPGKGPMNGRINVTGLALHSLAANSTAFAAMKDTALKLDMETDFSIDGPHLVSADFGVTAAGAVTVPEVKNGVVHIAHLWAKGHYDGVGHTIVLDQARVAADKIASDLKGRLGFTLDAGGAVAALKGELKLSRLSLAWPGIFAQPVQFNSVETKGVWNRAERTFLLERVAVGGTPFAMQASGHITLGDNRSPEVEMTGTIAPMKVRDLLRYWPLGAAAGGRSWVDANMPQGTVGPVGFELHFASGTLDGSALPAQAIAVKFPINKAEVVYIKGLTHMTDVNGSAVVTGTSFTADIRSGRIGPLAVPTARFAIPDFNVNDEVGIVTGRIHGAMPDVLTLVDMGNLRYPTRFGINTASSKGDTTLDLSFRIPMVKEVSMDTIVMDINVRVSGFALALGPHTQITDGNIAFAIDNDKLRAIGTTGIGGSPGRVSVDWLEEFKTTKPATTHVNLKGTLDDAARAALDLGMKSAVRGPVGISGTLIGRRGALTQATVAVDLTPANVTLDLIGINKPAGFPATARFTIGFGPKSAMESQAIRIAGPGTNVIATARYDAGGHLAQIQAPTVHIGTQNDFSLMVNRGSFGTEVLVRGRSLDGSRLGRQSAGSDDEKLDDGFHINARLDRLMLRDGAALSSFVLDTTGVADRPATMTMSGNLSKTASVNLSIAPGEGGRRLTLTAGDMGLLLQGLYGFTSMKGGKLEVNATLAGHADAPAGPDTPDLQGKATLKDFRVLNQPFLARLFTAGSLGGLSNLLAGQGIAVDTLDVPFSQKSGVITVHDVRATGPAIGVSADGYVDRSKNAIGIKGSLVPLFTLNSVLGNIPLLGTVITSKEGEGIIGMTYSVSGNADEPSVSVNPLSALAPGILRRIFEGKVPTPAPTPAIDGGPVKPTPKPNN